MNKEVNKKKEDDKKDKCVQKSSESKVQVFMRMVKDYGVEERKHK